MNERKIYFGFALADGMFKGNVIIRREVLDVDAVRSFVSGGVIPCLNPSRTATIAAMHERFDIDVAIPEGPPKVMLETNDAVIVMSVRGLPRLVDRHEYTSEEIASATFSFAMYTVVD